MQYSLEIVYFMFLPPRSQQLNSRTVALASWCTNSTFQDIWSRYTNNVMQWRREGGK